MPFARSFPPHAGAQDGAGDLALAKISLRALILAVIAGLALVSPAGAMAETRTGTVLAQQSPAGRASENRVGPNSTRAESDWGAMAQQQDREKQPKKTRPNANRRWVIGGIGIGLILLIILLRRQRGKAPMAFRWRRGG